MRRAGVSLALLCVFAVSVGCLRRHAAGTAPKNPPMGPSTSGGGTFDPPDLGVALRWPSGWEQRPSRDSVLLLAPAKATTRDGGEPPSIALDVPKLPPHIPGLIPIGSVRNGYVDDLRKNQGAIKTTDLKPPPIPAAAARLVRSTWGSQGHEYQETALLMVHADRVYILWARSALSEEPTVRSAFDEVSRSLKWTK